MVCLPDTIAGGCLAAHPTCTRSGEAVVEWVWLLTCTQLLVCMLLFAVCKEAGPLSSWPPQQRLLLSLHAEA